MDIVTRLRRGANKPDGTKRRPSPRELEAATEIEQLRRELAGRDAEIAAWMMRSAKKAREMGSDLRATEGEETDLSRFANRQEDFAATIEAFATAIASGSYRESGNE